MAQKYKLFLILKTIYVMVYWKNYIGNKKRTTSSNSFERMVGVDGFEPPTLCL